MPRCLNFCGKKYGSCHCPVKSETSFGELVKMRFQRWKICTIAVWLIIRCVPSIHNTMTMSFTHYGLVRALHRFGTKTRNGVSRTTWISKNFLNCFSIYSIQIAVLSFLQCRLGQFGVGGTRSERHPQASLWILYHRGRCTDGIQVYSAMENSNRSLEQTMHKLVTTSCGMV